MAAASTDPGGEVRAGLPVLTFEDDRALDRWLSDHRDAAGLWLRIAKQAPGAPASVTYAEAVDVALCHGWIDGQKAPHDDTWWLQRLHPAPPARALVEDQPRARPRR